MDIHFSITRSATLFIPIPMLIAALSQKKIFFHTIQSGKSTIHQTHAFVWSAVVRHLTQQK
jgi:hypothetical protein